jgi:DNA-binding NarL/FixJ family response regulator
MESHLLSTIDNNYCEPQTSSTEPDRDAQFSAMLPRIRQQADFYLRRLPKEERTDAIQEVVASAFVSYRRLIERGKSDLAYASPLARYGARQYLSGRRVGNRLNVRDVTSGHCQRRKKIVVGQLDQFDDPTDEWQQLLVEDRHSGPAEVATTRVDFAAWLESLPKRTRHVAETLATGEATGHVARMFSMSASRVSQLRRELYQAWRVFQGDPQRNLALPAESLPFLGRRTNAGRNDSRLGGSGRFEPRPLRDNTV